MSKGSLDSARMRLLQNKSDSFDQTCPQVESEDEKVVVASSISNAPLSARPLSAS